MTRESAIPSPEEARRLIARVREISGRKILLNPGELDRGGELLGRAEADLAKAAEIPLKVGILGGTGVGKSSLINALAGEEISRASHRRPYTDRAVVYHHEDFHPDFQAPAEMFAPMRTHRAQAVRHLTLCDLPDFDSLLASHKETVEILARDLDIFVWVASPEKYADEALFETLRHLKKSWSNFVFVLNKADLVPEEKIGALGGRFGGLLDDTLQKPRLLFTISVKDAVEGLASPGAEGFERLRRWIFQKREEKEVHAIRSANAVAELSDWMKTVRSRLAGLESPRTLAREIDSFEAGSGGLLDLARAELPLWVTPNLQQDLARELDRHTRYLWPVSLMVPIARAAALPTSRKTEAARPEALETRFLAFERRLAQAADRVQVNAPMPDLAGALDRFRDSFGKAPDLAAPLLAANKKGRGFRLRQGFYLALPVLFFLLVLAGVGSWESLQGDGFWRTLARGLANIPFTLFSGKGLSALAVLMLVELVAGLKIATGRQKRLAAEAKVLADATAEKLATEFLDEIKRELAAFRSFVDLADAQYKAVMGENED